MQMLHGMQYSICFGLLGCSVVHASHDVAVHPSAMGRSHLAYRMIKSLSRHPPACSLLPWAMAREPIMMSRSRCASGWLLRSGLAISSTLRRSCDRVQPPAPQALKIRRALARGGWYRNAALGSDCMQQQQQKQQQPARTGAGHAGLPGIRHWGRAPASQWPWPGRLPRAPWARTMAPSGFSWPACMHSRPDARFYLRPCSDEHPQHPAKSRDTTLTPQLRSINSPSVACMEG